MQKLEELRSKLQPKKKQSGGNQMKEKNNGARQKEHPKVDEQRPIKPIHKEPPRVFEKAKPELPSIMKVRDNNLWITQI